MENLNEAENSDTIDDNSKLNKSETVFKKPILFGKIGCLPKKLHSVISENPPKKLETINIKINLDKPAIENPVAEKNVDSELAPAQELKEKSYSIPYKEPVWSGLPSSIGNDYSFDVLKNGTIIESVNLMERPFWVFGRFPNCHIIMQHPTISRYHAVLQYRKEGSDTDEPGFYIYDLGSTHGTFLNKNRLKPKVFVRIQVGHMLKFGTSTRSYILEGPDYDEEEESELSVSELKQKRNNEIREREEEMLRLQKEAEEKKRKDEERGVDWGLGEDADEETDLSENPYAQSNNEELYLDDPKKALRGFFEREGLELEYDCNEQGMGQFVCKVELPLDDEMGRPIVAEVVHKGKKREAVIQCALEACRILDRYGVLRQATHESRKRKSKNWEDNDYYDSDEDTYLDRTGTIEKKREKRMSSKTAQKVETYESLVEKEKSLLVSITDTEKQISSIKSKMETDEKQDNDEDSLDSYMKELQDVSKSDKKSIAKLTHDLMKLRVEHNKILQLIQIVKPILPPLVNQEPSSSTSKPPQAASLPLFGKRKKIQIKFEQKPTHQPVANDDLDDEDDDNNDTTGTNEHEVQNRVQFSDKPSTCLSENSQNDTTEVNNMKASETRTQNIENIDCDNMDDISSFDVSHREYQTEITKLSDLERYASTYYDLLKSISHMPAGDRKQVDEIINNIKEVCVSGNQAFKEWDECVTKKEKFMKIRSNFKSSGEENKLKATKSQTGEQKKLSKEMYDIREKIFKVDKEGEELKSNLLSCLPETVLQKMTEKCQRTQENDLSTQESFSQPDNSVTKSTDKTINSETSNEKKTEELHDLPDESITTENITDQKKKKKNQRRIHQRQEKQEQERQKGYEDDASRENYSMWVPPCDQSGDGRTNLNDKYGY